MTAWLTRSGFPDISKHTVDRVMRAEGMNGLVRGRKTTTTIPAKDGNRAGDHLNREFTAPRPNHTWVTDFTYVPTWSGFVYVAFAIDLFSRAIVGWHVSTIKDTAFVEPCLQMALWRRDQTDRPVSAGMIHHSDAGSQYTSIRFTETVALEGLVASIGSVGDAYDNAAAETVMGLYKNEAIRTNHPSGPALQGHRRCRGSHLRLGPLVQQRATPRALGDVPPEEYEPSYYARTTGPSTDDAADKTAA